jgi:hypothetical protein
LVIDEAARMRLKRHFWAGHWTLYPEAMMLIGVITVIVGLFYVWQHVQLFIALGVSLLLGGLAWYKWRKRYVGSQKEFDDIEAADYEGIQAIALERFELKPEDLRHMDPCKFRNTATKRDIGHAHSGSRVGSDEKPRRSPQEYLVINFGHTHLFVFSCVWDLTMGSTIFEETHEFAFRDIACVELKHKKETIRINLVTRPLLPGWEKQGIKPVNGWLQVPTDESVSLRLAHGELMELFAWKRSTAGIPSGAGRTSFLTAQRLQKTVRELKQPRQKAPTTSVSAPAPKALPTIRQIVRGGGST